VGAGAAVVLLGIVSYYVVTSYQTRVNEALESQKQASKIQNEQYHEDHLTDKLLLSAFNSATIAGANGRVSSSVIIEIKLQERALNGKCDERELAFAASAASAQLHTPDFRLPDAPAFDNSTRCSVKWSWVAVPLHPDTNIALADILVKLPNKRIIHASKPIILDVLEPNTGLLASSISSIGVALLSLAGVIITAIMNNWHGRTHEPASKQGSAEAEPLDSVHATAGT